MVMRGLGTERRVLSPVASMNMDEGVGVREQETVLSAQHALSEVGSGRTPRISPRPAIGHHPLVRGLCRL